MIGKEEERKRLEKLFLEYCKEKGCFHVRRFIEWAKIDEKTAEKHLPWIIEKYLSLIHI